jgi:phenylalanine-4-hydroxylase
MCSQFLKASEDLNKTFKLSERIPQLNELSQYLKSKTGFTIKPTHGILSQR